jgi:hypothetical protein
MDMCNGKAFEVLKTKEKDYIDLEKFIQWWFLPLKDLKDFV